MIKKKINKNELGKICRAARFYLIKTTAESKIPRHLGGSLSCLDILVALYFNILRINPQNPKWKERDRFILSKGHAGLSLFTILSLRGFFSKKKLLNINSSKTKSFTHLDFTVPGVDMATGSLGQGLSVGVGMALGFKNISKKNKVYVLLGDGEINSGQIWEAIMTAAKYKLDNLVAIVDFNKLQLDGNVDEIMPLSPLVGKWKMFNWKVLEIDGHNTSEILNAFKKADKVKNKPVVIIAHTIKGKGLSFIEGEKESHRLLIRDKETDDKFKNTLDKLKKDLEYIL